MGTIAAAAGLAVSAPALAQADIASDTRVDEIVVTGTREQGYRATVATTANKTQTPVKETPFTIQVVTRELIEDRGVTTFGEAVRTVPGLTPQVGLGGLNDRFRLRGFITPGNLKNGLRRGAFIPLDELVNIEQVEVLKGPASALYGRFEPGGVVNMITKKPLAEQQARLEFTAGNYEFYRATADVTGPISDALGYRVTAAYQDADSFRDFADGQTVFISPVLSWEVGPDTTLDLEAEYLKRDQGYDRGFGNSPLFFQVPISRNYGEAFARAENTSKLFSAILAHRFSDQWNFRLAAQASDARLTGPLVIYGFPPLSGANTPNPTINRRINDQDDRQRDETLQAELYGKIGAGAVQHQIVVGAEYNRGRENAAYDFYALAPISLFNPVYAGARGVFQNSSTFDTEEKNLAIYAQDELRLGEHWRVLLGGRYETVDYNAKDFPAMPYTERTEDAFSPRIGVTYTPNDAVSLYASWGRSFQLDLFSRLSSNRLPEPTIGDQTEVGAKFSLLDGRLTPTVSLFQIKRKNGAVADPNDPTFTLYIQVGEQRGRGLEVDVPLVVNDRWRLLANYTYLDAEFTEDPSLKGNRIPNAPEHSGSLWSTYDLGGAFEGVSVGAGVQYMGEREANNANTYLLPSYTRFDANIAYRFGEDDRYRVQLNVFNLTDKRYYDSGGSFVPIYPGAPRTVRVSFGVDF